MLLYQPFCTSLCDLLCYIPKLFPTALLHLQGQTIYHKRYTSVTSTTPNSCQQWTALRPWSAHNSDITERDWRRGTCNMWSHGSHVTSSRALCGPPSTPLRCYIIMQYWHKVVGAACIIVLVQDTQAAGATAGAPQQLTALYHNYNTYIGNLSIPIWTHPPRTCRESRCCPTTQWTRVWSTSCAAPALTLRMCRCVRVELLDSGLLCATQVLARDGIKKICVHVTSATHLPLCEQACRHEVAGLYRHVGN